MSPGIALLTANDATSKYLVQSHPIGQVIGLRQAATLLVLIPYMMLFSRWSALRVVDWTGQISRGVLFLIGSVFIVWSLAVLPLATAITMLFASPIFMVVLSAPLLAALVNALRDVLTRRLSRTETSIAILFWSNIILMAGGFATLPFGWVPVTSDAAFWFIVAGVVNGSAHFCIIEALRTGEASVVAPIRYTALLWAALLGFIVWGELPEIWLWAGAAVMVGSSLYMIRAERRRG